jgi:MGT family glycosyltransferase
VSYEVSRSQEGFANWEEIAHRWSEPGADAALDMRRSLATHARFRKDKPDVILFDGTNVSGAAMARNSPDIPSISYSPSFAHNERFPLSMGGWEVGDNWVERTIIQPIDEALPEEKIGSYLVNHVHTANIVFIPKFFQYHHDTFDDRFYFVGPSLSERAFYGKWSPPREAKNVVLISLGTVMNAQVDYFRACIDALGHLDIYVVMTVGAGTDIEKLGEIPPNFEIHPFISHLDVLPHATAFIGHGGMNSTMESLYYGVPMLLAPQDGHQRLISQRVAELGLGTLLTAQSQTQTDLAEALLTLLDDKQLIGRVRAVGAEMRKTSGAQAGADVVERVYRGR